MGYERWKTRAAEASFAAATMSASIRKPHSCLADLRSISKTLLFTLPCWKMLAIEVAVMRYRHNGTRIPALNVNATLGYLLAGKIARIERWHDVFLAI
jgi:hypothetical protein